MEDDGDVLLDDINREEEMKSKEAEKHLN